MHRSLVLTAFALVIGIGSLPAQQGQVHTDRDGAKSLTPPPSASSWQFAIFGDRTGGPESGLAILEDAVADVNLVGPDLVMTVGDLINGYNARDAWMRQMRDYQGVMNRLRAPWFPVAGNHDIYWRGKGRPKGGHEGNYERHFGPLWYWFRHKDAAFVVLYSDEGDPKDDSKGFRRERHVQFSDAQLAWLKETLAETKKLQHTFVFLHHPRWRGKYYENTNWPRVETMLRDAGNVHGVFAGHMHEMRYDRGAKGGLELFTLGATGSSLEMDFPAGGFMHHYNLVTVRDGGIDVVALPVGAAVDHRRLTPARVKDLSTLLDLEAPEALNPLDLDDLCRVDSGARNAPVARDAIALRYTNPSTRPIEIELELSAGAAGWSMIPARPRLALEPGQSGTLDFSLTLDPRLRQGGFAAPRMAQTIIYQAEEGPLPLPRRSMVPPAKLAPNVRPKSDGRNRALALDGSGCVAIDSADASIPDGPFTLEGRIFAHDLGGRRPFIAKSESSEYCIFVNGGRAEFSVHLDGRYVSAKTKEPVLETDRWHHLAGVFDGREVRMYVDGRLVASAPVTGKGLRRRNKHPLFIGADPNGRGRPVDHLQGRIDDVRLSRGVRYVGERVRVPNRLTTDDRTLLLLDFDSQAGPYLFDASSRDLRPLIRGGARLEPR